MSDKIIKRKDLVNFGKNKAIIIGIDHYPKIANGSLSTPVTDAAAFKQVLIDFQGFEEADIEYLANPTKAELEALLKLKEEKKEVLSKPRQETSSDILGSMILM